MKVFSGKQGHRIMIKWSVLQHGLAILNIHVFDSITFNYEAKSDRTAGGLDKSSVVDGDFSIPFSGMGKCSRQKIRKYMVELTNVINSLDVIDIY